jgi:NO-binding membrane sensor protein with MHYT domain
MPVTHEPWLVVLSVVVAIQGAYVGLRINLLVDQARGLQRRLLLAAASLSLAVAIWSMHFVGMLAMQVPFPVDYLVFPTLLSFLVCAIVVGVGVFAVSSGPLRVGRLVAASLFMGGGIASMHYIGMSALHACAHMVHAPLLVAASVAIAVAASGLALCLAQRRHGSQPLLLSAAALGAAIACMHYTAMQGTTLFPLGGLVVPGMALSSEVLAVVVAVVAFVVSGIFLLALIPEAGQEEPAGTRAVDGGAPQQATQAAQLPVEQEGTTHFVPVDAIVAIHANAHYTTLFDGRASLFCPLAIGVVESRLDTNRFIRVHRSHIVNVDRIAGLRRVGDTGIVELTGSERYTVPVSRGRIGQVRSRLRSRESALPSLP